MLKRTIDNLHQQTIDKPSSWVPDLHSSGDQLTNIRFQVVDHNCRETSWP